MSHMIYTWNVKRLKLRSPPLSQQAISLPRQGTQAGMQGRKPPASWPGAGRSSQKHRTKCTPAPPAVPLVSCCCLAAATGIPLLLRRCLVAARTLSGAAAVGARRAGGHWRPARGTPSRSAPNAAGAARYSSSSSNASSSNTKTAQHQRSSVLVSVVGIDTNSLKRIHN